MRYLTIPVTHYQQNCSLIWCEQRMEGALVDPGGDISRLLAAVEKVGVKIVKILVTHGHLDHVGAVAAAARHFSVPIEGPHKEDEFWIERVEQQAEMMGFSAGEGFTPTRWLNDGDEITLGEQTLAVVHCPGHTPGHVVFHHKDSAMAFVGDVLFHGSIGRTDFPRGDHQQLLQSITEKLWPLGDDVRFVPGHGPESTFGHERRTNPFVADHRFG